MARLTHVDPAGALQMVNVGDKPSTQREATAEATVHFTDAATLSTMLEQSPKGDVIQTARLAGIMAAKRTADLVPLCHPLPIDHIDVECVADAAVPGVRITATVRTRGPTGVEMEALTACSIAALTVIDMLKSVDRWMTVDGVRLLRKSGGHSGTLERPESDERTEEPRTT